MKKIISFFTITCLLIGIMAMPTFADSTQSKEKIEALLSTPVYAEVTISDDEKVMVNNAVTNKIDLVELNNELSLLSDSEIDDLVTAHIKDLCEKIEENPNLYWLDSAKNIVEKYCPEYSQHIKTSEGTIKSSLLSQQELSINPFAAVDYWRKSATFTPKDSFGAELWSFSCFVQWDVTNGKITFSESWVEGNPRQSYISYRSGSTTKAVYSNLNQYGNLTATGKFQGITLLTDTIVGDIWFYKDGGIDAYWKLN